MPNRIKKAAQGQKLNPKFAELPSGFPALFEELEAQGVPADQITEGGRDYLAKPLTNRGRLQLLKSASQLARKPGTGILAGRRQKVGNYGVYGYALASSTTFREAARIYDNFIDLSGAVLEISSQEQGQEIILKSHNPHALGDALPFIAEYWRSSQTTLMSAILGKPLPSISMHFPFPEPAHIELYEETFPCELVFDSDVMEWRIDASVLSEPCIDSDPDAAEFCELYCKYFVEHNCDSSNFQQLVVRTCIRHIANGIVAADVAKDLNMSSRSLFRRLKDEGISFKEIANDAKKTLALEYLTESALSVETISARCGYQDPSNFRKAFRKWTGKAPTAFRKG